MKRAGQISLALLALQLPVEGRPSSADPIAFLERLPRSPEPFLLIDWIEKARGFDRLAFDATARGEYLPLLRLSPTGTNLPGPVFGLPSYVGSRPGSASEAIAAIAAVVGASLVGIDKENQAGRDWVGMCLEWHSAASGLVSNNPKRRPGSSFWYDLFPAVLLFQLADLYPHRGDLAAAVRANADAWRDVILRLGGAAADFNHTAFRFATSSPHDNGKWREPDAAAGLAWLMHAAWKRFGDQRYAEAAGWCLDYLERWPADGGSPLYEVLLYYAPITAARANVSGASRYNLGRMLDWCFSENLSRPTTRPNWGMIAERWGDYDVHGLMGSTRDGGGYAFAMNTFQAAAALAPVARYDVRYARRLGRWLLNVANSARYFYGSHWPADQQSSPGWQSSPPDVVAYEGLRRKARVLARLVEGTARRRLRAAPPGHEWRPANWTHTLPASVEHAAVVISGKSAHTIPAGAFTIEQSDGNARQFREIARWPRHAVGAGEVNKTNVPLSQLKTELTVRLTPQLPLGSGELDVRVDVHCFTAVSPFASGDPIVFQWGPATDLSVYGSAHVGFLGALIERTNVPGTVRVNLIATDFFRDRAFPTWLYYNPHDTASEFVIESGEGAFDIYDAVSHRFLARNVKHQTTVTVGPDEAAVLVLTPIRTAAAYQSRSMTIEGVTVDYLGRSDQTDPVNPK